MVICFRFKKRISIIMTTAFLIFNAAPSYAEGFSLSLSKPKKKTIEKREIIPMSVYTYSPKKRLAAGESKKEEKYNGPVKTVNGFFINIMNGNRGELHKYLDKKQTQRSLKKSEQEFENAVTFYNRTFSQENVYLTHKVTVFDSTAFIIAGIDNNGVVVSKLPIFLRKTKEGWRVTKSPSGEVMAGLLHGYPYDSEEIMKTRAAPGVTTDGPMP